MFDLSREMRTVRRIFLHWQPMSLLLWLYTHQRCSGMSHSFVWVFSCQSADRVRYSHSVAFACVNAVALKLALTYKPIHSRLTTSEHTNGSYQARTIWVSQETCGCEPSRKTVIRLSFSIQTFNQDYHLFVFFFTSNNLHSYDSYSVVILLKNI